MPIFRVTPKRGEAFLIEIAGFEFTEREFLLFNAEDDLSQSGFLSLENVAAIIPEAQDSYPFNIHKFEVQLQGHADRISIHAAVVEFQSPQA